MSRRNGRILAVQALYSYDVGKMPLDELLKLNWNQNEADETVPEALKIEESVSEGSKSEEADFARLLISGTINR